MNSEDFCEQEKLLHNSFQKSSSKLPIIKMYDECYSFIKLDWVKKSLEKRWERKFSSYFAEFRL